MPPDSDTPQIEFRLRLCMSDGREIESGTFTTSRKRQVGDSVNLPTGPDQLSRPGYGYVWRVRATEDAGRTLLLDFEKQHDPAAPA